MFGPGVGQPDPTPWLTAPSRSPKKWRR